MNKNLLMMPDKNKIKACYDSYSFLFAKILENIEHKLRETIYLASNPTYKTRVKSFSSYYKKILRQKSAEACEGNHLVTLTDMIGIRVICAFLEDLGVVQQQIQDAFEVREIEKKGAEQSFREFGYESIHILVSIPKECIPEDLQGLEIIWFAKFRLELFFRTLGPKWSMSLFTSLNSIRLTNLFAENLLP